MMEPTHEQAAAVDAFGSGEGLLITAGAGTGKTSTLRMLATSTSRRGVYVAFNKSIADEAAKSFPGTVSARTAHSFAYGAVRKDPGRSGVLDRMRNARPPLQVVVEALDVEAMTLPTLLQASHTFRTGTVCGWIRDMVRSFCMSADEELGLQHLPTIPSLAPDTIEEVAEHLLPAAQRFWADQSSPTGSFAHPTHDTYLKLWHLSRPTLPGDYILFDEAQDANPVIAAVVAAQDSQLIYVGDEAQAIYGFTGAIDAMKSFEAAHRLTLTRSWRFGPKLAEAANAFLEVLGSPLVLQGNPQLDSQVVAHLPQPHAVLCRTNVETIGQAIDAQHTGARVHLLGGADDSRRLVEGARDLISGTRSHHPELTMFVSWDEVRQYTEDDPHSRELAVLVDLVDDYGIDQLLHALGRCVPKEETAHVVVGTAHKAKGREWSTVMVADDFDPAEALLDLENTNPAIVHDARTELMLAYVATTRAQHALKAEPFASAMGEHGFPEPVVPQGNRGNDGNDGRSNDQATGHSAAAPVDRASPEPDVAQAVLQLVRDRVAGSISTADWSRIGHHYRPEEVLSWLADRIAAPAQEQLQADVRHLLSDLGPAPATHVVPPHREGQRQGASAQAGRVPADGVRANEALGIDLADTVREQIDTAIDIVSDKPWDELTEAFELLDNELAAWGLQVGRPPSSAKKYGWSVMVSDQKIGGWDLGAAYSGPAVAKRLLDSR